MSETVTQEQGMESLNLEQAADRIQGIMEQQEAPTSQPQEATEPEEESVDEEVIEATAEEVEPETSEEVVEEQAEEEQAPEVQTYRIKAEGEEHEVTLDDLKQSFQLQANVRKKMEHYAHENKAVEELKQNLQAQQIQFDQMTKSRTDYDGKLAELEQFLSTQGEDLAKLKEVDPTAYAIKLGEEQQRKGHILQVQQERQRLAQEQQAQNAFLYEKKKAEEKKILMDNIPDLKDPDKRRSIRADMLEYAKSKRVTEQEFNMLIDSRMAEILYDATMANKVKTAKPEIMKKVKKAPKMVKSGVATPSSNESERLRKLKSQAKKSGHLKDAAKYFEAII